jgi:hypothetical protein
MKREARDSLLEARATILVEANRVRNDFVLEPLRSRHIQQAVCVARRRQLVDKDVLVAAGFNATER